MKIYDLLKLLSDSSRLRILSLLTVRKLNVTEMQQATNLSQANVSKHLKRLYEAGIVIREKEGQTCWYYLNPEYLDSCLIFDPIMEAFKQHPDYREDLERLKE